MLTLYTSSSWAFSIDDVAKQAQSLAGKGYEAPKSNLPSVFRDMKYADYQQIQFNHDKAYWNNLKTPFKLEFYHQGMYFDTPVKINEVTATAVKRIKYSPDYFTFGDVQHDKDTVKDLGFAGFKVLYPINSKDKNDEIVSMLGASYFRVIGAGQVYGLSARGLAIDTALPSGEEFPRFKEFWIERPKPTDKRLTIYALLDSPRAKMMIDKKELHHAGNKSLFSPPRAAQSRPCTAPLPDRTGRRFRGAGHGPARTSAPRYGLTGTDIQGLRLGCSTRQTEQNLQ